MEKLQLNLNGQLLKLPNKLLAFEPTHASRYWILATLLSGFDSVAEMRVVDVGGKKGLLRFFPGFSPTIIDMEESDEPKYIQGNALKMPFQDNEFDFAISCDVLEHIPEKDRAQFLAEMLRVSKRGIIFCAPFDNPGVSASEIEMNDYHQQLTRQDHRWLKEHIDNGLPNEQDIEKIIKEYDYQFSKFRHFSLDTWRFIVKAHLLQSAFNDDKELAKVTQSIYENYYRNVCHLDYAERGYRTFYLISKNGGVSINLPNSEDSALGRREFIKGATDQIFNLLEAKMREQRNLSEHLKSIDDKGKKEILRLQTELQNVLSSRRWRAASKLANVGSLITRRTK